MRKFFGALATLLFSILAIRSVPTQNLDQHSHDFARDIENELSTRADLYHETFHF